MLEKLADNLWTFTTSFKAAGFDIGGRTTIIRFSWGGLLIHSPTLLTQELERIFAELGTVQYVIAPNSFHHLYVRGYLEKYPHAQFWTVPQVVKKRPRLPHPKMLNEAGAQFIGDEVIMEVVNGRSFFSEAVFLHVPSKTLIVTDLIFNMPKADGLKGLIQSKIFDAGKGPGPSRFARFSLGKESHTRVAIHKILNFDFERIIMAHGEVVTKNAKEYLSQAFSYLVT